MSRAFLLILMIFCFLLEGKRIYALNSLIDRTRPSGSRNFQLLFQTFSPLAVIEEFRRFKLGYFCPLSCRNHWPFCASAEYSFLLYDLKIRKPAGNITPHLVSVKPVLEIIGSSDSCVNLAGGDLQPSMRERITSSLSSPSPLFAQIAANTSVEIDMLLICRS
jgi:hypothetical protein